ncbi:hypothetical protein FRB90_004102, partial [Tulasnella sp. 427]
GVAWEVLDLAAFVDQSTFSATTHIAEHPSMTSQRSPTTRTAAISSSGELQLNEVALASLPAHEGAIPIDITKSAEVGFGGYGEVFLATLDPTSSPKDVAVKELRAVGTRGVRARMAFRLARELKIWAKAHHPNILELIGFYLSDNYDTAQLVSAYMPHGNVAQYISKAQPEVGTRIEFVKDTAAGLEYLHSCDPPICHADLKAANVLVTDDIRAVLCDFGLAEVLDSTEDGPSGLTTSRTIRGSLRYMAPELILEMDGMPKRTLESDVWAWGCLLYEIMTDALPYATYRADIAVIQAIIRGQLPADLPPPSAMSQDEQWDLRSWFIQLVLPECWNFEPSKRPSMVEAVREMEFTLREIREELEKMLEARAREERRSRSPSVATVRELSFMEQPLEERVRTVLKRSREEEVEPENEDIDDDAEFESRRKRARTSSRQSTPNAGLLISSALTSPIRREASGDATPEDGDGKSWAENPDMTVMAWNLQSVHDGAFQALRPLLCLPLTALYSNHHKTAISNLPLLVSQVIERKAEKEFKPPVLSQGYSKDLLNILLLAYSNQFTSHPHPSLSSKPRTSTTKQKDIEAAKRHKSRQAAKAERWKEEAGKDAYTKETAEKLSTMLKIDPPWKAPHVAVARIFASSLEKNAKILRDISKTESKEDKQRLR